MLALGNEKLFLMQMVGQWESVGRLLPSLGIEQHVLDAPLVINRETYASIEKIIDSIYSLGSNAAYRDTVADHSRVAPKEKVTEGSDTLPHIGGY